MLELANLLLLEMWLERKNMRAIDRILEIKEQDEQQTQQTMIFLLNPKDKRVLQSLAAWKNVKINFQKQVEVSEESTLEQLWELVQNFNIRDFATTLGCTTQQALPRLRQLKNLRLIYPDGSINRFANMFLKNYIKRKIEQELS